MVKVLDENMKNNFNELNFSAETYFHIVLAVNSGTEGCMHDWLVNAKLTNPLINPSESLSMTQQQHISYHLQKERQVKYMVIVMLPSIQV